MKFIMCSFLLYFYITEVLGLELIVCFGLIVLAIMHS